MVAIVALLLPLLSFGATPTAGPAPAPADPYAPPARVAKPKQKPKPEPKAKSELYRRLGGKTGIAALASEFVDTLSSDSRLMADPVLKQIERLSDKKQVKAGLTDRICERAGGPCRSQGAVLKGVPRGPYSLTAMEWFYIIEDASSAMNKRKLSYEDKGALLKMLWSARSAPEERKAQPGK